MKQRTTPLQADPASAGRFPTRALTNRLAPLLMLLLPLTAIAATPLEDKAHATIEKGLDFLKTQQKPDGSWERPGDPPAMTALPLKAFMGDPGHDADEPFLEKGFDKLLSYQKPDGGIFNDVLANYNTAIAISALAASKEAEYQPQMQKALEYLRRLQWTDKIDKVPERQNVPSTDPRYGGFGYGKRERPDGSNMQIALDALHDAGVKPQDPAFQAAVIFASHLQNRSESNNQPWAGNDGGFIYTDADGGNSPAGEMTSPDGRKLFRSYGSMTYAGLKSMIYAGLSHDDPRVQSAWNWITKNWTLDENPGLKSGNNNTAESGLYYYFHTTARALHAYGQPIITDAQGAPHDWRLELIDKLTTLQKPDGSWSGQTKWMENNPTLATSFAVLALEEAQADLKEHPSK
jgi:squalene-hopene/tetraprenyl-beta-curcumene cyclase